MRKYGAADGKVLADDDDPVEAAASDPQGSVADDGDEDAGGVRGGQRPS